MSPYLAVCDLDTVISWYEDFLEFNCIYKDKIKNPDVAILEQSGNKIFLAQDPDKEAYASNIFIIEVDDINTSYEFVESKGCIVIQAIEEGFYSVKQFIIKDYEDNKIVYVQKT